MLKKTIALFLSVILVLSLSFAAGAVETPTIKVLTASAAQGDTVTVDVQIQNNPGINTFSLGFEYDTTRLSLKNVTVESSLGGQYSYGTKVVWINDSNSTYNGKILTLTFAVLDNAKEGDAPVSVTYSAGDISDYDENDVNFSLISGKITVGKSKTEKGLISVASAAANVGNELSLDVHMDKNPGINTFTLGIEYDKSVLSLENVEIAEELGGQFAYGKKAVWFGDTDTLYTGKILTLKFKVLDSAAEGDTSVNVTYSPGDISNYAEEDVDFDISNGTVTVKNEITLTGISVKTNPVKLNYFVNEQLDTTGLSLNAVYSNGKTETVTSGYVCSPTALTVAGTQKITVSYQNKTTSFNVNVSEIAAKTPTITVGNATAKAGDEVSVSVYITNNPGFSFLKIRLYYDKESLEFITAENGEVSTNSIEIGGRTSALLEAILWSSAEDATADGKLVTLKFKVLDNTVEGDYSVNAKVVEAYNYDEDEVNFASINGTVTVRNIIYGDVNGDGKINGRDVIKLSKYLAAYDESTGTSTVTVSPGADVNGDGKINGRDLVKLRKYLANYDESTGESTIILGPSK